MKARTINVLMCGFIMVFSMFCTSTNEAERKEADTYRLDITVAGSGTVTAGDVACTKICSYTIKKDEQVSLNAKPLSGWHFVEWAGDCSEAGACTLTMTGNKNVTAIFSFP